jgi:hypothetical protein
MASGKLAKKRTFATVVELVSANGGAFRTTARRYSLCTADADDAYQRGLEIAGAKTCAGVWLLAWCRFSRNATAIYEPEESASEGRPRSASAQLLSK